jgi:hypothetical protein
MHRSKRACLPARRFSRVVKRPAAPVGASESISHRVHYVVLAKAARAWCNS